MKYRVTLRGFDLTKLEAIVKYSTERYHDVETGRSIVVGRYNDEIVMLPYEIDQDVVTPVTVHATTRQQVNFRFRTGRFIHE